MATKKAARKAPRKKSTSVPASRSRTPAPAVTQDVLPNPYVQFGNYKFLIAVVAILVAIWWLGSTATNENRAYRWFQIFILTAAFAVVVGRAITGYWRGILIDSRNKLSLSRLQMLAWTLVVLSAIFTAALSNISYGWQSPMDIQIPSELWVLMGISTGSLVASPAIMSNKVAKKPKADVVRAMEKESEAGPGPKQKPAGVIARNSRPQDARWSDLMMGEEVGNYSHVDLGKMQMFFITFILVVGYAAAIAAMFSDAEVVSELPVIEEGMNVLLGISHTGYLANKSVSHTQEASTGGS